MNANTIRLVLGAMLAAALVGCGSSEPETSASASTPPAETTPAATPDAGATAEKTTGGTTTSVEGSAPSAATDAPDPSVSAVSMKGPEVVVSLEGGKSFTLQLDGENTPKTAARITELVKKGFYDGQRFHRVVPDFCVQWGDPQSRNGVDTPGMGSQGSGVNVPFEEGKVPLKLGALGMASTAAKSGGDSQMFVVTGDMSFHNGNYAAFGKVVKGMDVVLNIQQGDKIASMKLK